MVANITGIDGQLRRNPHKFYLTAAVMQETSSTCRQLTSREKNGRAEKRVLPARLHRTQTPLIFHPALQFSEEARLRTSALAKNGPPVLV